VPTTAPARVVGAGRLRRLNILVATHGEVLAHTTRALVVAEELRARGANVAFAMRGDKTAIVEAAGFAVHDIAGVPLKDVLRRLRRGTTRLCSDSQAAESVNADIRMLERERPDIVLSDFRPSMAAAARITKTPHVSVLNATWTPYLDHEQVRLIWPVHTRFGSAWGTLARALAGPDLMRFRFLDSLFQAIFRQMLVYGVAPYDRIQAAHGVVRSRDLNSYWLGDLTLVPDYPTFMPLRADAPSSVKMTGPLVWQSGNLAEVQKLASMLDRSRPTVYATVGSTGDPGLFPRVIEAAGRKNWNLVITKAGLADLSPSRNVFVYDFLPGEAVMRISDVTICQGGSGTISQAIAANCPFVGVACNIDQEWNLDRASRLGIASVFYRENVAAEKLADAIDTILARKEAFRARFAVFDDDKRRYLGAKTAVDAIEAAIEDRTLDLDPQPVR
jgi:UDP:flavonoid glycosyltransferase YjiC (YdhE family)